MRRCILFMILTVFYIALSSTAYSYDEHITRCVDAGGNITFTDNFCVTTEPVHIAPAYHGKKIPAEHAAVEHVTRVSNNTALSDTELASLTQKAVSQCVERFPRYFSFHKRGADATPSADFETLIDQYSDADKISLTLGSLVNYSQHSRQVHAQVECTLQKWDNDAEWLVGFAVRELE